MWLYKNTEFTENIEGYEAFVYLIIRINILEDNESPTHYIGKKVFWSKKTARRKQSSARKEHVKIESDWMDYYGSSEWLQSDIIKYGKHNFERHIIHLCKTRSEANYLEVKEQIINKVLSEKNENNTKKYYNKNIFGKILKDYESYEVEEAPVFITDGFETKIISIFDEIPPGWKVGRKPNNYCWVNDGEQEFKIRRDLINSIEYRHLFIGRLESPSKNKKAMVKDDLVIYVNQNDVSEWENKGFCLGGLKKGIFDERGIIYVCNDDLKKQQTIPRNELDDFLKENPGWRIGQFKRASFNTEDKIICINLETNKKEILTKHEFKENEHNLVTFKTKKVIIFQNSKKIFEGFLKKFINDYNYNIQPFQRALRKDDGVVFEHKGKNKFLNELNYKIIWA